MADKITINGRVEHLKLIQVDEPPLVYVKIKTEDTLIHALRAKEALSFLLDVIEGDELAIYGYYNKQKQFVIQKYLHRHHAPRPADLPAHLSYPNQKKLS